MIVPPNKVINFSDEGRESKLEVGCPATGLPADDGVGIAKVDTVAERPDTPLVGSIVSAVWPKGE